MKNILLDISGKIDTPFVTAINDIKYIADSLGIPFMIVGASARDFIAEHFYNIKAPRMTTDLDLGMKIVSWDQFNQLESILVKSGKFRKDKEKQRFRHGDVFLDIVPFGDISNKDQKISWPPDHDVIMSVIGFKEVYKFSTPIRLSKNPPLEVKIASLPGLALLKLLSWKDNYPLRKKDAQDLLFIIKNYEHTGNFDRLYDIDLHILESENFDTETASIRLLGKDMAQICDPPTLDLVKKILEIETNDRSNYHLSMDMTGTKNNFENILFLIKKLKDGIFEL